MVSALCRKEPEQRVTYLVTASTKYAYQLNAVKPRKKNFPYALQEFINSHMDLPDIDEITGKQESFPLSTNKAE